MDVKWQGACSTRRRQAENNNQCLKINSERHPAMEVGK